MVESKKRKAGRRPPLTPERIRETALELIEKDGLEELSTRKLGRALGVEAMAIYWYFPNKDALLDAVVESLVSKIAPADVPPAKLPGDFIDALRGLAHAYRNLAKSYPKAFPLLALRRFATEPTYEFLNTLFTLAEEHGLDARATARFYRLVSSYCSGAALNELAGLQHRDEGPAGAPYPRLVAVWKWLGPEHYDDVFSFGLEVLLSALRAEATGSTTPDRPSAVRPEPSARPRPPPAAKVRRRR
jgi:AcrR family transcriptional regulator